MIIIEITEPEYRQLQKTIDRGKKAGRLVNSYMKKITKERDEAFEVMRRFNKSKKGVSVDGLRNKER